MENNNMNMCYTLLSMLLVLVLAGCSGRDLNTAKNGDNSVAARGDKTSTQQLVSRGKPGAPVELAETEAFTMEPGVPSLMTLTLLAPQAEGVMQVEVSSSDELTILSQTHFDFSLATADYLLPIQVVAAAPGRYYVHLHVTIAQQGREGFRALAAIVQVGMRDTQARSVQKKSPATSSASSVILLPAQETVERE
jgi:hypothetical protein